MNQILNIETNYSLLSSLISIDSLISYAKENGITVLGNQRSKPLRLLGVL